MDELRLDGNAIAGLLQEVFGAETTTAAATCGACGLTGPVGAAYVYRGAGIVIRCPRCDNALAKIAVSGERRWVSFPGLRALELHE